jgi:hypothetical protein
MSGIAIVVVFLLLAALMIARKLPALLAVPVMALAIGAIAGAGPGGVADIFAKGSVLLAPTIATLIFGALLSRVVLSTGIAETIVTVAAEFGGDRPLVLALVLCAAVALLFTSVTGLGAIIMIGTIVLPVMMTVGVPRATAATLFLMAFGLGYIFNLAQWKFYGQLFSVDQTVFGPYIYVLAAIQIVAIVAYVIFRARTTRDYATFAIAGTERKRTVHPIALITPILPVLIYKGLGVDATIAFAIAALFGVLVTRPRDIVQTLVAAAIRGLEDVAPAVILMLGIGMLLFAAKLPVVAAAVTPLIAAIAPRSPVAYVVIFGLLSPLALYRGPLNIYGVGVGVFTVLATMHVMPAVALVAAVMAVVQVQNVCDPTNTQNVWIANFTGVTVDRITRLTLPFQVGVATLAVIAVVLFGGQLFGVAPFALAQPASAADLPGLTSPASAAKTIAVLSGNPASAQAAAEIQRSIDRGWAGFHALAITDDPTTADCRAKKYSAVTRVSVTAAGANSDVGIELLDCAGWMVDQWHTQGTAIRQLALADLFRVRVWARENPAFAANVFDRGLAYDPQSGAATYFYTLFKPSDGYMRVVVRAGGPAYVAGLRSSDVVDKIDGRFWWEYGTYQTQLRAYDGKPHSFVIERGRVGGPVEEVTLGEPYLPSS